MRRFIGTDTVVFSLILFPLSQAIAQPTQEETSAFFAKQRQNRADFDRDILAEIDSRTAATQEFNRQARADRIAFTSSLPDRPSPEDLQRFNDFNAAMLQKQKDFQQSLATLPKSKFEQALEDFDKQAVQDRNALDAELSTADPETRSEAIRQFQNELLQKRAQLKNESQNELAKRQRQFKLDQAQKVRNFLES